MGRFENLKLSTGAKAVLITSSSQSNGETQNLYCVEDTAGSPSASPNSIWVTIWI